MVPWEDRIMAIDIAGREKITYGEGDCVVFNIDGVVKGEGIIRGRVVENVIDIWIVQITTGNMDRMCYPYSCVAIPHVCLTPIIAQDHHRF
jgi:hypothetical protein